MFGFLKKQQKPVEVVESIKITVRPRSIDVQDVPDVTTGQDTTKPCWYRLFGRSTTKVSPEEVKQSVTTSDDANAAPKQKDKKRCRRCKWWKKKNQVTPGAHQGEVEVNKSLGDEEQKRREDQELPQTVAGNDKEEEDQELETTTINKTPQEEVIQPKEVSSLRLLGGIVPENPKKKETTIDTKTPVKRIMVTPKPGTSTDTKTPVKRIMVTPKPETFIDTKTPEKRVTFTPKPGTSFDTKTPEKRITFPEEPETATDTKTTEKRVSFTPKPGTSFDTKTPEKKVMFPEEPKTTGVTKKTTKKRVTFAEEPEIFFFTVIPEERGMFTHEAETAPETPRQQEDLCFGFPNPIHDCFMNSCLQSLLTLVGFIGDFDSQEEVWRLDPESSVIQTFMDINKSHGSKSAYHKLLLLNKFRIAVSKLAPEFQDQEEKDAHEFLIAVLEQIRMRGPELNVIAESIGTTYSCPVVDHMLFRMKNTRTCMSCGAKSSRQEEFTNLSLDLPIGGGTVEQMIEAYLQETELEYRCKCGSNASKQRSSFIDLPRVLILHLKRFRFTPIFTLEKCFDPVTIQRDLIMSSKQNVCCYNLVSTISHFGTETSGHYISDGADPDLGQENPTDRWFTYNDEDVTQTFGSFVCEGREESAYILFYKKQE